MIVVDRLIIEELNDDSHDMVRVRCHYRLIIVNNSRINTSYCSYSYSGDGDNDGRYEYVRY